MEPGDHMTGEELRRCRLRLQRCCTKCSYSKDYGPVQGVVMVQLKDKDKFQRTRVSEEVRTEGQALVLDVEGTGRELTGVVRSISKVTKAVALGDLNGSSRWSSRSQEYCEWNGG
ncbi:hypothetical protein BYT27DRAFT_7205144 [Phlegmacium glaucopus]|nr:hypothetical protein BYT27DRAFT_7205144 [Phlegmacium glaucopus]